jgi:plasmid stabilization system protein ParE
MKVRSKGSKKILKDGFVSTDLYLKYREAYEEKLRQLEKYTGEQENEIKDKLELERTVSELEQKLKYEQISQNESDKLRKDIRNFFRGRWKLTYSFIESSKEDEERFVVDNDQYFILSGNGEKILTYNIALFDEEPSGKVAFLKYNTTGSCVYRIVNIYRNSKNENVYEGREYWYSPSVLTDAKPVKNETKVKYERIFETN